MSIEKIKFHKKIQLVCGLSLIVSLLIFTTNIYGWFSFERKTAGIREISNPMSIFINAGQEEDIMYMDLTGIDLSRTTYKDFVFCIRGINISKYAIQLAYTTNNQFEYELYPAVEVASDVPANALGHVSYESHDSSHTIKYYYIENGKSPIDGTFKNKKSDSEILAEDNDSFYEETYGTYENVQKYARPLYWQTIDILHNASAATGTISNGQYVYQNSPTGSFTDYYILRIIWGELRQNDKETDIIYLSAKNKA